MRVVLRLASLAGLGIVIWALATAWGAVVHGHPAYAVLLVVTLVVSVLLAIWSFRLRPGARGRAIVLPILAVAGFAVWLAVVGWLRPFVAVEPALAAMSSDSEVEVVESATAIELRPRTPATGAGLVFQPGARVDPRAYAAVLRPLAEAGHLVVIVKQPLGIGFLAASAPTAVIEAHPEVGTWVVGGHSLGGTVAASAADDLDDGPVAGLLLYASYPASDMSESLTAATLSLSGSEDGLATPAKIDASRADLPGDAEFVQIDGAVHAFFGDYGPQPGDGTPTITHDAARAEIADRTLAFVEGVG